MRPSIVWTLFRKELLETIRDRRTLLIMILVPMLIYPLFGILASQARMAQDKKLQSHRFIVGVMGGLLPGGLVKQLEKSDELRLIKKSTPWKQRLRKGELAMVIQVGITSPKAQKKRSLPKNPHQKTKSKVRTSAKKAFKNKKQPPNPKVSQKQQDKPTTQKARPASLPSSTQRIGPKTKLQYKKQLRLRVYYASTQESSRTVYDRAQKAFKRYRQLVVTRRLAENDLPLQFIQPIAIARQDVISAQGRGRYVLSRLFPLLIILMTIVGAFYPAIELTAGEKERGTLETLLTAPMTTLEVVAGKYLTVTAIAMFSGGLNILSIWLTFTHGIRLAGRISAIDLGLEPYRYLAAFGFLILVAALASAVMIVVASLARSFKEGQNYVTPAYLVCLLPAVLAVLPGSKPTLFSALIPIQNVTFAIQGSITGELTGIYIVMTLLSMGVMIMLALVVAAKLFEHEQALFQESEFSIWSLFSRSTFQKRLLPTGSEAFFLLTIQFLLLVYAGMTVQQSHPTYGLGITMWGIFFLPALTMAWYRKIDLKTTFRLRGFDWRVLPGVFLMVVGIIPILLFLTTQLMQWFPGFQAFLKSAEKTFSPDHFQVSFLSFVLLLSVSPGICEEFLFRGFFMTSMRRSLKPWAAILVAALFFGAFHLSAYRMLPTLLLGVMMGWICYRTGSIFPAMFAHALNNGSALVLQKFAKSGFLAELAKGDMEMGIFAAALFFFGMGVLIVFVVTEGKDLSEDGAFQK